MPAAGGVKINYVIRVSSWICINKYCIVIFAAIYIFCIITGEKQSLITAFEYQMIVSFSDIYGAP